MNELQKLFDQFLKDARVIMDQLAQEERDHELIMAEGMKKVKMLETREAELNEKERDLVEREALHEKDKQASRDKQIILEAQEKRVSEKKEEALRLLNDIRGLS